MKKLVYIDACVRGEESRTRRIAEPIIERLAQRYDITTFRLPEMRLEAVTPDFLAARNAGEVPGWALDAARAIAAADRLVIAAPFWDMSFPSALKVFFEHTSLFNVTFADNGAECFGLCRCTKVLYITTRGMNISTGDPNEQATPYIKALSALWGLGELICVSAQNMDYSTPEQIESKIAAAISEGLAIAEEL